MRHVANPHADKVAAADLAVDRGVEHSEVAHVVGALQMDADGPDALGFERRPSDQSASPCSTLSENGPMPDSLLLIGVRFLTSWRLAAEGEDADRVVSASKRHRGLRNE